LKDNGYVFIELDMIASLLISIHHQSSLKFLFC
jgi:hypothetical protein